MSNKEHEGHMGEPSAQHHDPAAWMHQAPPPHHPGYPPHMMHPHYYGHPGMPPHYPHPHHYHQGQVPPAHIPPGYVPPQMAHAYVGGVHPGMAPPPQPTPQPEPESDPMFEQAQAMLEGALGEEAGMFKEILGTIGMNDKEFWKGAMVGAAAALVLSNENVRKGLMGALSGAGNMLKSGGETVKDTATQTASTVQQNVTAGSEIFRDTYAAGKEGFKESVERHQQERTTQAESPEQIESLPPSDTEK